MGKGNRVRTQNADERKAKKEAAIKKAAKDKLYHRLTVVVASVLAIALVFGFIWAAFLGNFIKSRSVHKAITMKTENYSISAAQFNYLYMSTYLNYYSYASYYGFSTDTPLKDQAKTNSGVEGYTWHDYFVDETKTAVRELLVLCEAAKERGIELDDESKATIDENIEALKSSADGQGVSFEKFVKSYYGEYINEADIRSCMEMQILAGKAAEAIEADPTYTDEELEAECASDMSSYYFADYRYFEVEADYVTGASEEVITQAKADAKAEAQAILEAATDEEAFTAAIDKYYRDNYTVVADETEETAEDTTEGSADDTTEEATEGSTEEPTEAATEASDEETTEETTVKEELTESELEEKIDATLKEAHAYSKEDGDELGTWLFEQKEDGSYVRVAGDTTIINDDENGKYTVYFLVKPMYRHDYKTRNVRHILITVDSYDEENGLPDEEAEAKANELLEEWKAGEATEDSFADLATKNTKDEGSASTGGLYENVYKGQMVEEFENWLFDDARVAADADIVKTDFGYHIMYYVGEAETEKWAVDAETNLRAADYEAAYTALTEKFAVTIDDKAFNKVKQAGT